MRPYKRPWIPTTAITVTVKRMHWHIPFQLLVLLPLYYTRTLASYGDTEEVYQTCLSQCESLLCPTWQPSSLALQLTRWTCADDCKYTCMHLITAGAIQHGEEIYQYYGKWPFWRFAGMQEPASVAFSLLNLFFHARGVQKVWCSIPRDHPMRWYYIAFAIFSINAWIWSSVFHTRGE